MLPASITRSALSAFYHDAIISMGMDFIHSSSATLHSIKTIYRFPDDSNVSSSSDNKDSDRSRSDHSDVDETMRSYQKSIEHMYNLHASAEEFSNDDNHSFTFSDTDEFLQEQNDLCNAATCRCRPHNWFGYSFGDIYKFNYNLHFLHPSVHERTYFESWDMYSVFRSSFWMPLHMIDELSELLIERGWVQPTKRVRDRQHIYNCSQLLMMTTLEYLGNRRFFWQFKLETTLSKDENRYFLSLYRKDPFVQDEWIN